MIFMRRMRRDDIELPWQIEVGLMVTSAVVSALTVAMVWIAFDSVMTAAFGEFLISLGGSSPQPVSIPGEWPFALIGFLVCFVRIYFAIRRALVCRLDAF